MPLTSPSVTDSETERRIQELLYEYYRRFFTGAPVDLGQQTVTLPECDYLWNQQTSAQPLARPEIHTIFSDLRPVERIHGSAKLIDTAVTLTIFVRVSNPGEGDNQPDFQCRLVADAIKRLFQHSEHYLLAQKGFHHSRVRRGPTPIATPGLQTRMLTLTCRLYYPAGI